MKQNYSEAKEFMLIDIQNTALWRSEKAIEYPEHEKINLNSHDKLMELYDYVEKLPEDHKIFLYWIGTLDESFKIEYEGALRRFGYQNQSETPEEFVNRFVKELINEDLINNILDNRDHYGL